MHFFSSHRMHLCIYMFMCFTCVPVGAYTGVCSCWWRSEVATECFFRPLFHLAFGDRVSRWTWSSLVWLDGLASELCRVPTSAYQSGRACRSVPSWLAFYTGAGNQIQVIMFSQRVSSAQSISPDKTLSVK